VALVLTYDDVRRCITMADAVAAIEAMCHEPASGQALHANRVNLRLPNGWMRLMPGALISSGVFGYKEFHLTHVAGSQPPAAEVRYAFHLFEYQTGVPLATMDANFMTAIRTGATSGVAMKYMARPDSAVLGIIGSGSEARSHVQAVAAVRNIKKAVVFSRSPERREQFARDMERWSASRCGRPVASKTPSKTPTSFSSAPMPAVSGPRSSASSWCLAPGRGFTSIPSAPRSRRNGSLILRCGRSPTASSSTRAVF
jgi:ornithine cyclodeaminase/alanine dehydrogenase-like protein (mu-crystallin family)